LRNHQRAVRFSLDKLVHAPISTLLIVLVIGISMALPAGLYVVIKNLHEVASGWDDVAQLSVFLRSETSPQAAEDLAQRLRARADVSKVQTISPEEAMQEFRLSSGFGEALDAIGENPLPTVLVVTPTIRSTDGHTVEALAKELEGMPEVDKAQSDLEWLRKFYGIMDVMSESSALVAVLLACAVLLVVGNTIRLEIQNRREEIEVSKLIGAPNSYVRRPFLYGGFWYGLIGGLVAWLILVLVLGRLQTPVMHLAGLYSSAYQLLSLGFFEVIKLLGVSSALGFAGSWLALFWHLREIEPR
jgi:cell division transport system permease protein